MTTALLEALEARLCRSSDFAGEIVTPPPPPPPTEVQGADPDVVVTDDAVLVKVTTPSGKVIVRDLKTKV